MGSSFQECNSIADILFVLKLEQIINTLDYTTGSHVVATSDYRLSMKEMVSYLADDNFQGCNHILILLVFLNFWVLIKLQQVFSHILPPLECNSRFNYTYTFEQFAEILQASLNSRMAGGQTASEIKSLFSSKNSSKIRMTSNWLRNISCQMCLTFCTYCHP